MATRAKSPCCLLPLPLPPAGPKPSSWLVWNTAAAFPALPLLPGLLLKLDPSKLSVRSAGRVTLLHTCRTHTAGAPHLAFLLQECLLPPPPPATDTCTEVSLTFFKPLYNSHRPRDGFLATSFECWTTFPPLCSFASAVITIWHTFLFDTFYFFEKLVSWPAFPLEWTKLREPRALAWCVHRSRPDLRTGPWAPQALSECLSSEFVTLASMGPKEST